MEHNIFVAIYSPAAAFIVTADIRKFVKLNGKNRERSSFNREQPGHFALHKNLNEELQEPNGLIPSSIWQLSRALVLGHLFNSAGMRRHASKSFRMVDHKDQEPPI